MRSLLGISLMLTSMYTDKDVVENQSPNATKSLSANMDNLERMKLLLGKGYKKGFPHEMVFGCTGISNSC